MLCRWQRRAADGQSAVLALGGRTVSSSFGGKPERSESGIGLARRDGAAALDLDGYERTGPWIITANPFRRAANARARLPDAGIGREIEIMDRDDGLRQLVHVPSYHGHIGSAEKGRSDDRSHSHI